MTEFSDRLKYLRDSKGWTKTYVANHLGIKMQTYANYEYGIREPDLKLTNSIAKLYGVSTDYLLNGKEAAGTDEPAMSKNQKLIAYSIDPDISDEERQAIIEMVQAAKKFRKRI